MADMMRNVREDSKELDSFLDRVGEIESVIKGLSHEDDSTREQAVAKADKILKSLEEKPKKKKYPAPDRTGVNRTVINTKAFQDKPNNDDDAAYTDNMDQAAFMDALEKDAARRYADKQRRKKIADKLKDEGNVEFKAGNYHKAIELYTEARDHIRDNTAIYTNRAQAYIKVGEYHKAIEDCEWALKVFENCLKAYVHMGRAYLALKEYDKAVENFQKVLEIDPTKKQTVHDYLAEVELTKATDQQEMSAKKFLEEGSMESTSIVDVMEKIGKEDQLPMYYSGGLRLLCTLLTDTNQRTLFRTNGGFNLVHEHSTVARCLSGCKGKLSSEEADVCWALLDLCCAACQDNEENQRTLFDLDTFPEHLLGILENKKHGRKVLKESAINLLHNTSMTEIGRAKLTSTFSIPRLLGALIHVMKLKGVISSNAVGLLNNMALDKKFKKQLRGNIEEEVLPAFESLMSIGVENALVLPTCISSITNLCEDAQIRAKLSNRRESWVACCCALEKHMKDLTRENNGLVCQACLGLLMNISLDSTEQSRAFTARLTGTCCGLLNCELRERALGLLSHLLPKSPEGVKKAMSHDLVTALLSILKETSNAAEVKYALKSLTGCTASNTDARRCVVKAKGALKILCTLLSSKDETVIGNAALCLGHCIGEVPSEATKLHGTNIIMDLLSLTRDCHKEMVQQNCAILIAKLAKGDPRHLERLRELHGLEILHSCMKHIKD